MKSTAETSIVATATYVPDNPVSSPELLDILPQAETLRKLGIENRYSVIQDYAKYLVGEKKREMICTLTDMLCASAEKCLQKTGLSPESLGLFIAITNTAGRPLPCPAYEVVSRGLLPHDIPIANMQNQGCSAFLKASELAGHYLKSNPDRYVLISAAEAHTGFVPPLNQESPPLTEQIKAYLFGDGSFSAILQKKTPERPVLSHFEHLTNIRPEDRDLLRIDTSGTNIPEQYGYPHYEMSTKVPIRGLRYADRGIKKYLEEYPDESLDNVHNFAIHTGGRKLIDKFFSGIGIEENDPRTKPSHSILERYGNLSSCGVGFILHQLIHENRKGKGFALSFGGGFSISLCSFQI